MPGSPLGGPEYVYDGSSRRDGDMERGFITQLRRVVRGPFNSTSPAHTPVRPLASLAF